MTSRRQKSKRAKSAAAHTNRAYHRDAKGRFASTGTGSPEATKHKRRRKAAIAGTAVAGVVAASQTHPASRTRTAITRRKLVKRHVARAASDHRKSVTRRARALPHRPTAGAQFPKAARKAAKREARKLTRGYRRQVKRTRKATKATRAKVRRPRRRSR